jgi:hypothetical protein
VVLILLAQGIYAVHLQTSFYRRHGPFYDSVAYMNRMAEFHEVFTRQGFGAALKELSYDTILLPYLEVALVSPLAGPSRALGVWLQSFWLMVLALSIFYYLWRYRGASSALAVCLTLPFVSFRGIYQYNGGLSDFRMDLSQYIFFSLVAVWYLASYENKSLGPWLAAGVFAALGCLARATLPVHLALAIGPLAALRLWKPGSGGRMRVLAGIACLAVPPFVVAAPFFISNYEYLHYYYVQWNLDANAQLPLRQSLNHIFLAVKQGGEFVVPATMVILYIQLRRGRRDSLRRLDWKLAYLGLCPAMFLVLRGAGINPFVSMPALFGGIMFCLAPIAGTILPGGGRQRLAAACLAVAASLASATIGPGSHAAPLGVARMETLREIIGLMRQSAVASGKKEVFYATSYVGAAQADFIRNVLIYDYGEPPRSGALLRGDRASTLAIVAQVEWEKVRGANEKEKIKSLVEWTNQSIDYVLVPDEATVNYVERALAGYVFNTKTRAFGKALLESGKWKRLSGPLTLNENEAVYLYGGVDPQPPM